MHFTSRTFKLWRELPKQKRSVILLTQYHTRKYEPFYHAHSKPKPHQGHTIIWRSSLRIFPLLEREKQQHHRHMVRIKPTPRHAEVRPLKCVIYKKRNPVTFVIHRRREFYLLDQQAWERKHQAAYKRHVHMPPAQLTTATMTKNATHHRCN